MTTSLPSATRSVQEQRAFVVWLKYQRRAEVLAPLLNSQLRFFPHAFGPKALRPLDYMLKLVRTVVFFVRLQPPVAFLQVPPMFPAIAAILTRTPYVLDVHNLLVQSSWSSVPLTQTLVCRAAALIAHNTEIADVIKARFPESRVFTIPDPIMQIAGAKQRRGNHILFICSFGDDEPIDLILDTVQAMPEHTFIVSGDVRKLPDHLRAAFAARPNVSLPGFLSTDEYHFLLSSSRAAVVLSTRPAVQPSGACEALSSDTPLVVTRSDLIKTLFGAWATLVDNNASSLVSTLCALTDSPLDLSGYRWEWNERVARGIAEMDSFIATCISPMQPVTRSTSSLFS